MPHPAPENSTPDWLDELLTEEPAYIDDAGFASQVVQKLPARRHPWMLRRLILGLTSFIALFFGSMALPQNHEIANWTRVAMNSVAANPTLTFAAIAALGVALLSASVVWVWQEK